MNVVYRALGKLQKGGLLGLLLAVAGCGDILNVGPGDITVPSQFDNASGAILRRNKAVADFDVAQSSQVVWSGLVADELTAYASLFAPVDALHITGDNEGYYYPYGALTTARLESLEAIETLKKYASGSPSRIGQLYALAGMAELYFAENMCSGIPLAAVVNDLPTDVGVLSRDSLIAASLAHFDSALKYDVDSGGATNDSLANLAKVASARALLFAGRAPDAASLVSGIPLGFTYVNNGFDGQLQVNSVNQYTSAGFPAVSVADREGGNGLNFISGQDSRVMIVSEGTPDGTDTLYGTALYATPTAQIVLASGIEASLIRAEAALITGQIQAWADTLNALRGSMAGLPPIATDSTILANGHDQVNTMFRERAFWLFLTGHRQGDLRRLVRQYGRTVATTFPTGRYPRAGATAYGTDVTFIPVGESNNPNYHGCIDRAP